MKFFKKILISIVVIIIFNTANAQVTKVSLQASGLTCSMCSNAINKALRTLDFIDNVDPNIKTSTFEITFKPGSNVDFEAIKEKVEKAGFGVASFIATIDFNNIQIESNKTVTVGDKTFYFLNIKQQVITGSKQVKMINKGFISSKEYKKNVNALPLIEKGVYYATI